MEPVINTRRPTRDRVELVVDLCWLRFLCDFSLFHIFNVGFIVTTRLCIAISNDTSLEGAFSITLFE